MGFGLCPSVRHLARDNGSHTILQQHRECYPPRHRHRSTLTAHRWPRIYLDTSESHSYTTEGHFQGKGQFIYYGGLDDTTVNDNPTLLTMKAESIRELLAEKPRPNWEASALTGAPTIERSREPAGGLQTNEYAELKLLIKEEGLLTRQPGYYTFKIVSTLGLLASSLAFLTLIDSLWLLLLDAVFLAFIFTQMGFIGHDAGHRQVFRSPWRNDIIGLFINLLLGLSRTWWVDKHNRHHSNPNQPGLDPDTFIPIMAFSEEQATSKSGFYGFMVKYQAYFYLPVLAFQGLGVRLASLQYLMSSKAKYGFIEPLLMAVHLVLYLGLAYYLLGLWPAVLFVLVHQAFFGLYSGSVFAPNHKGMPILDKDSAMDFMRRQVITARNIYGNPLTDFMYGGLNYQIEHHLFPNMPRNNLKKARKIVKSYCVAHSIPYKETNIGRSQVEILQYLHQVSAPLRRESVAKSS